MQVGTGRRGLALLRREDGASAVEFALVVPLLLLLVFGIVNFGVFFAQQLALNNGVRQGARTAVVAGNTTSQTCADVVASVRRATGPAIAMTTSAVNVTVRTMSADGATIRTTACGTTANPTSTNRVCASSARPDGTVDSILVDATYATRPVIPFPAPGLSNTLTLTSRAVFRCEFS